MSGFFITGTDTGVGKTFYSVMLVRQSVASGKKVVGMKPVASGCQMTVEGLRNEDALQLIAVSNLPKPYTDINPYSFEPAIAPHLAAQLVNTTIDLSRIKAAYLRCCEQADMIIVEGVGGWMVPLNSQQSVADLAVLLGMPVILVVGIRLGCLNHALLTVQSISAMGLTLHGWVANRIEPDCKMIEQTVANLKKRIAAPLLADLGWKQGSDLMPLPG